MADQDAPSRTIRQQCRRLFLGEIITPVPKRRDRNAPTQTEELNASNPHTRAVQNVRLRPVLTRLSQVLGSFVVTGNQKRRFIDGPQHLKTGTQFLVSVAIIAR